MAAPRRKAPSPSKATEREAEARSPLPDWALVAAILVAVLVIQGSAVLLPFFADDYLFLDQARFRSLAATLTGHDPLGNFVRPVGRQLWFWMISRLGESPVIAHALNLALFLGVVALLFVIARRLAGPRAAAIAAGLVAIHYAADVPVRWVSGCQDLLATLGALGAIAWLMDGRRALAAVSLALALLSKETVALTPLIAAVAARRNDEPWTAPVRRAWPLGLVTVLWAVVWVARQGQGGAGTVKFTPDALAATFVHLVQVLLAVEWRKDQPLGLLRVVPPIVAIALVVFAIAFAERPKRRRGEPEGDHAVRTGLAWAAAGALPIAAVTPIWSAYFYLFALCGAALALGAWLRRAPVALAAVVVALLGWTSEGARRLEEFETAPRSWSAESHVNRFYLDRAFDRLSRYLSDLKRMHPTMPAGSTLYFAGIPGFVGLQAADGPLVRSVYRDSSLRSHYATEFGLHQRPGPYFVFQVMNDSLQEITHKPGLLNGMAVSAVMDDKLDLARRILDADLARETPSPVSAYLLAWIEYPDVPPGRRKGWLDSLGVTSIGGPTPEVARARTSLAAGDTVAAFRLVTAAASAHGLDAEAHGLLADLITRIDPNNYAAVIEAYAALRITPDDPAAWRRWATMLGRLQRYRAGLAAIRHYFAIGGEAARRDTRARQMLDYLVRVQPGGELVQQGLRLPIGQH